MPGGAFQSMGKEPGYGHRTGAERHFGQGPGEALAVLRQVQREVVGKDGAILRILLAMLARGHVLLEDIPGVGKTTLAMAFSRALGPVL